VGERAEGTRRNPTSKEGKKKASCVAAVGTFRRVRDLSETDRTGKKKPERTRRRAKKKSWFCGERLGKGREKEKEARNQQRDWLSCLCSSKRIAERQVFLVGEVQEPLLDADARRCFAGFGGRHLEPPVLAVLFSLLLGLCSGGGGVTLSIFAFEVPAEEKEEENLADVGCLRDRVSKGIVGRKEEREKEREGDKKGTHEDDGPWNAVAGLVLILPPLRRHHLSDGICDEPHGMLRELLRMSRSGRRDPGEREHDGGCASEFYQFRCQHNGRIDHKEHVRRP